MGQFYVNTYYVMTVQTLIFCVCIYLTMKI